MPCCCGTGVCPDRTYSVFDVTLRVHGTVYFGICDGGCSSTYDPVAIDFTINFNDDGGAGNAVIHTDPGTPYDCGTGGDTLLGRANLVCRSGSICSHGDTWEVRLEIDTEFCNLYPCLECMVLEGNPFCPDTGHQYPSQTTVGIWDTGCMFNATYVTIQDNLFPVPNGTFMGSTSMTAQGDIVAECGGTGAFPSRDFGSLTVDWTIVITP